MHQCQFCNKSFLTAKSLGAHRCKAGQAHTNNLLVSNQKAIVHDYTIEKMSVLELSKKYKVSYPKLFSFLMDTGISIESWTDPQRRQKRVAKIKHTLMERYGVDNTSKLLETRERVKQTCLEKYGVANVSNSIPSQIKHYILGLDVDPSQKVDFAEYRRKVDSITNKNRKFLPFDGVCYYSGCGISREAHYNSNFKASIDHKIPVIVGYEQQLSPEEVGSLNNLVWCAKLLNTYKRSMTEEQFKSSGIIERFIKYESELRKIT